MNPIHELLEAIMSPTIPLEDKIRLNRIAKDIILEFQRTAAVMENVTNGIEECRAMMPAVRFELHALRVERDKALARIEELESGQ